MPYTFLVTTGLISSSLVALSSSNWLFIWMSLEVNLLSFIPLIILDSETNQKAEAAVKYFLAQAFGSATLLASSMMIVTDMPNYKFYALLQLALLLKLGGAPLHFWYTSVMSSLSWINCLILSTWQKLAPLAILSFMVSSQSSFLMMASAGTSAIVGGVMGMAQTQLRPMLAYSSIGHIGWMLSMLTIASPSTSMIYFLFYVILITPLFLLLEIGEVSTSSQIPSLKALSLSMGLMLSLLLFSLGGLPPLTGFLPKLMVVSALAKSSKLLVFLLITGSVMNLYYYLSIAFSMLMAQIQAKSLNITQKLSAFITLVSSTILLMALPMMLF